MNVCIASRYACPVGYVNAVVQVDDFAHCLFTYFEIGTGKYWIVISNEYLSLSERSALGAEISNICVNPCSKN